MTKKHTSQEDLDLIQDAEDVLNSSQKGKLIHSFTKKVKKTKIKKVKKNER